MFKTENVFLKTKYHAYYNKCQRLQSEVDYLRSILANDSILASLIKNIPNVPNVRLTSSFVSQKRLNTCNQQSGSSACKKQRSEMANNGVCLHVAKDVVSLEFCQSCSKQASLL